MKKFFVAESNKEVLRRKCLLRCSGQGRTHGNFVYSRGSGRSVCRSTGSRLIFLFLCKRMKQSFPNSTLYMCSSPREYGESERERDFFLRVPEKEIQRLSQTFINHQNNGSLEINACLSEFSFVPSSQKPKLLITRRARTAVWGVDRAAVQPP